MTDQFLPGDRVQDWEGDMATVVRHDVHLPQPNLYIKYDNPAFGLSGKPYNSDVQEAFFTLVSRPNAA